MTGFDSKRRIALDRLDDDIQVYAQSDLKGESMTKDEARTLEALKYAASKGYGRDLLKTMSAPFTIKDTLAQPAQGPVAIHQFRAPHCADWYDGIPDHHDGHGPYEVRTLYTAPPAAQPPLPVQEPIADVRGLLAARLTCWHRLTGVESDELVALFQALPVQPLTDVQIETGRRAPWGFNLDAFTAGAKFAEAAHNIGGAKP
jgi:hypothetical protein